jgi:bacterioferritin-associated ferredoxin
MRAMYICNCNAVTDADIRREVAGGVQSFAQLQERTGCSDCCGSCEAEARDALAKAHGAVNGRAPSLAISVLARCCPE